VLMFVPVRSVRDQTFSGHVDNLQFADASFDNCAFDNCFIGNTSPEKRGLIRNVNLRRTGMHACYIRGVRIEDCSVDGLKRLGRGSLHFWGAVFKHVKLSGSLCGMSIRRRLHPPTPQQDAWDEACCKYYSAVDWAFDLREAKFTSCVDFSAIPGNLVLRDPETQVLVTRAKLLSSEWRRVVGTRAAVWVCIDWFLRDSLFDDVVLVASKKAKYFRDELSAFESLRREGIAT
jgi:hypothetical protein